MSHEVKPVTRLVDSLGLSFIHIDGKVNTPACNCGPDCEMPCWQRVGIADACSGCGCPPFEGDEGL